MNSYPFLDSKLQPVTDASLGDIVRPYRKDRIIDITESPFVAASDLRVKLETLLMAGELDSGLPVLYNNVLKGLIPAPDLEFGLDELGENEDNTLCLMSMDSVAIYDSDNEEALHVDFTRYIDPVSQLSSSSFVASILTQSRLRWLWMSIPPWTLSTSASPSWACVTFVLSRMDNTPALCIRRRLSSS